MHTYVKITVCRSTHSVRAHLFSVSSDIIASPSPSPCTVCGSAVTPRSSFPNTSPLCRHKPRLFCWIRHLARSGWDMSRRAAIHHLDLRITEIQMMDGSWICVLDLQVAEYATARWLQLREHNGVKLLLLICLQFMLSHWNDSVWENFIYSFLYIFFSLLSLLLLFRTLWGETFFMQENYISDG